MTLQQKMLAKQSKKGFTLVELVVVIAILAILAAIAIPAVIGIINSASQSSAESDAATLDQACKNTYAGVVSGTINNTNCNAKLKSNANMPAATAANSAKKSYAKLLTVQDAAIQNGLESRITKEYIANFSYLTSDGTIVSKDSTAAANAGDNKVDFTADDSATGLKTTLGALYANA